MSVKPIPDGYHTVTPYIMSANVAQLLDFVRDAFHAKETHRMSLPDGAVMHAEFQIGDSMLMAGQSRDEWKAMPTSLYLYVENVDEVYGRALAAGATSIDEPSDKAYGDRGCGVKDAHGNVWWIATHIEDVADEEIERRMMNQKKA